jgi:hypothetical protein
MWFLLVYMLGAQQKVEIYSTDAQACVAYETQVANTPHVYQVTSTKGASTVEEGGCKPVVAFTTK